jgi:cell shape-determining protein MreD
VTGRVALRLLLVIVAVVAVQDAVMVHLRVFGAHPELIWLLPLTAGLLGGAELGAVVGFFSGMALDCLLPTPFGLTAFVATLIGYGIGTVAERSGLAAEGGVWWLLPGLGAAVGVLGVLAYAAFGIVFGEDQFSGVNYLAIIPVVTFFGALFAVPIWMLSAWAVGDQRGARRSRSAETSW